MIKRVVVLLLLSVLVLTDDSCYNVVQVSGNAEVKASPDRAIIRAEVKHIQDLTSAALAGLNGKTSRIIQIFNRHNITKNDYSTSNFRISPKYRYEDNQRILEGQEASQGFRIIIRNLEGVGAKIGTLIDALSEVNGIEISGVSYELSEKRSEVKEARKRAFESAKSKAEQLAKLSRRKLNGVKHIDAVNGDNYYPFDLIADAARYKELVPSNKVSISEAVNVIFYLD